MSMANVAGVLAGAGAGGTLKRATGTPYGDPERIKKMMATRPGLNANRRVAKKQDLSGAVGGAITGRGGNTQALGRAAMGRLAQQAPPPPPPDANALQTQMREAQGGGGMTGFSSPSDAVVSAQAPGGGGMGGWTPEMMAGLQNAGSFVPDIMPGQGPGGNAEGPGAGGGMAPQLAQRPAQLQGAQLEAAMTRKAMPMETAGGPGVGQGGFEPPGMSPDPNDPRVQEFIARMGGQGISAPGIGGGLGIPPQIAQRLQALKSGGVQSSGAPGVAGRGGVGSSFADFWQRQQGGAVPGGGAMPGMAPRGM